MPWEVTGSGRLYTLLNESRTPVVLCKRAKTDLLTVFQEMKALEVPLKYSEKLEEIKFTSIDCAGTYIDNKIKLTYGSDHFLAMPSTFVHELAHHLDVTNSLADDDELLQEKKDKAQYMKDRYCRKNIGEYIAVGFETYYCSPAQEVEKMKLHNRVLFDLVERIHRQYSAS